MREKSKSQTVLLAEPGNIIVTELPVVADISQFNSLNTPNLESTTGQLGTPEDNDINQLNLTCCGTLVYG